MPPCTSCSSTTGCCQALCCRLCHSCYLVCYLDASLAAPGGAPPPCSWGAMGAAAAPLGARPIARSSGLRALLVPAVSCALALLVIFLAARGNSPLALQHAHSRILVPGEPSACDRALELEAAHVPPPGTPPLAQVEAEAKAAHCSAEHRAAVAANVTSSSMSPTLMAWRCPLDQVRRGREARLKPPSVHAASCRLHSRPQGQPAQALLLNPTRARAPATPPPRPRRSAPAPLWPPSSRSSGRRPATPRC